MDKFRNKYRIPSARAQWWDYGREAAYFITICTKGRCYYFGDVHYSEMKLSDAGQIAHERWHEIPAHFAFVHLDAFVVMPNHVHGILIIRQTSDPHQITDLNADREQMPGGAEFGEMPGGAEFGEMPGGAEFGEMPGGAECTDAQFGRLSASSASSASSKKSGGHNPQWHSGTIGVIINQYKRICTINIRKTMPDFGWQSRFHDHIIRNESEFRRIADYIHNNPARWSDDKFFL